MARIAGVDLPREKRIEIGLTYVYGIGRTTADKILAATGINPDTRVKDLTREEEAKIRDYIDQANIIVEGDHSVIEGRLDVSLTSDNVLALSALGTDSALFGVISISHFSNPPYFFLLATVRLGPLQVRALVLVRWPRQGRFLRWRMPR